MDEVEYKLKTGSSVLIVNAIDKLISIIKSKFQPTERKKFVIENEELKYLREKCSCKDRIVSLTACQGLLALVELGVLEIGHTMSTVITLLPSAHNYSAIISTIAGLLVLDLRSRLIPGQVYSCQFSLRSPQHPFITVLLKNKDAEDEVLAQMHALCTNPDYVVSSNALELLRPVLTWLTCNPERRNVKPWRLLLSLPQTPALHRILILCLSCQQISNSEQVEHAFTAYLAVTESAIYQQNRELVTALVPMLARISNQLILCGRDPRACLSLLQRCFSMEAPQLQSVAALTVTLIADNLVNTSALYLHEIFNLCLNIISKYELTVLSLSTFVALSLQWIHLPSYLTSGALKEATKILEIHRKNPKDDNRFHSANLLSNKAFESLVYTDKRLTIVFKLNQTWERIKDDPDKLKTWLKSLESIDNVSKFELAPFLMGVTLLSRDEPWWEEIVLKALKILIGLVDIQKDMSVQMLPLLLYKISNDKLPSVKWECLKALPLMAKNKENVPTIVSVLNKLKTTKSVPTSFLIMLYASLAETQVRCFPYLQEVLKDCGVGGNGRPDDLKFEVEVAKAVAVKRICEIRATNHGVELVSTISSILNRCTDKSGCTPTRIALLALSALWRGGAVAPVSTWKALETKMAREQRTNVQIGICELLSEIPALRLTSSEAPWLTSSCARLLWTLICSDASEAACNALGAYKLTMYTLKDVPEIYRRTVKLPASFCKTPADAARNPEDVLDYIPCEIWPEVYKNSSHYCLPHIEKLVSKLIEREVRSYRSGVYHIEAGREPSALNSLPVYSVVRGVMECFRKQATHPSYDYAEPILLSMFSTLAMDYPKPLPPIDLCFLHELCHKGREWKKLCVTLATRQALTCMSAKRFMENQLQGLNYTIESTIVDGEPDESDIMLFFDLLPVLCRTMPPNAIRGPLEKFLGESFSLISNIKLNSKLKIADVEDYLFIRQLNAVAACLKNDRIHDANRTLLAQIVENYFTAVMEDNLAWAAYLDACKNLPASTIERMTSLTGWWEVTSELARRAIAVRAVTVNAPDVDWIDDVLKCSADYEGCIQLLVPALKKFRVEHEDTRKWFLQLLSKTQVAFNESNDLPSKVYFIDVVLLSIIILSQVWAVGVAQPWGSGAARRQAAPGAVAILASRDGWDQCAMQLLEWLRHTRDNNGDETTSLVCQRAIFALKETSCFVTQKAWYNLDSQFTRNALKAND